MSNVKPHMKPTRTIGVIAAAAAGTAIGIFGFVAILFAVGARYEAVKYLGAVPGVVNVIPVIPTLMLVLAVFALGTACLAHARAAAARTFGVASILSCAALLGLFALLVSQLAYAALAVVVASSGYAVITWVAREVRSGAV